MFNLFLAVAVLTMSMMCSSCEPLRKKFTRSKKVQDVDNSYIPVLAPEEYPAPENNPIENYTQHYALVKAWFRDLWTASEQKNSSKKAQYTLKQVYEHLDVMARLVNPEKQAEFVALRKSLDYFNESTKDSSSMINQTRIQSDLRQFDRQLRKLNPGKTRASLLPATS